jgi:YD repeat-containing protein
VNVFRSILIAFILLLATAWTGAFSTSRLCMDGQKNRTKGNAVLKELPNGQTLAADYDGSKRPTSITDELGNVTTIAYDPSGNLTSLQGPLGNPTTFTYDAQGNILSTTDPSRSNRGDAPSIFFCCVGLGSW